MKFQNSNIIRDQFKFKLQKGSYKYPFKDAHKQLTHNSHATHTQFTQLIHTTMSHNTSPDNESVYNIATEYLFPIFPNENEPQNTPPTDLFPIFPYENQPLNTPPEVLFPPENNQPANNQPVNNQPANNPLDNLQNNPFGFSEEYLRQLKQDMEVFIEFEQEQAHQEATRRERERREAEYRWEMGLGP